jgi:hypothetical protein
MDKIVLPKEQKVRGSVPDSRRKGRKKLRLPFRYANYLSARPGKGLPICINRGCPKRLKRDQLLVCSEKCKEEVINKSYYIIDILEKGEIRL